MFSRIHSKEPRKYPSQVMPKAQKVAPRTLKVMKWR